MKIIPIIPNLLEKGIKVCVITCPLTKEEKVYAFNQVTEASHHEWKHTIIGKDISQFIYSYINVLNLDPLIEKIENSPKIKMIYSNHYLLQIYLPN